MKGRVILSGVVSALIVALGAMLSCSEGARQNSKQPVAKSAERLLFAPGQFAAMNVTTPPAVRTVLGNDGRLTAIGLGASGAVQRAQQNAAAGSAYTISALPSTTATSTPAIARNWDGTFVAMARTFPGSANILQRSAQTTSNGTYGSWTHEAGDFSASTGQGMGAFGPALVAAADGRLDGYIVDINGALAFNSQTNIGAATWLGSWAAVAPASAPVVRSEPAVIKRGDGLMQVFVRTASNGLSFVTQPSAGSWSGATWSSIANAVIVGSPAVALGPSGLVTAVALGWGNDTKSGFGAWTFADDGAGGWTWAQIGGASYSSPVAVTDGDGKIHVFSVNAARHLQQNVQTGSGWTWTWTELAASAGTLSSAPAAAKNSNGDIEVFARFDDGSLRRMSIQKTTGTLLNSWSSLGGTWTLPAEDPPSPLAAVTTQHNDNQRTGANLKETVLNVGNVNPYQFGLLFKRTIDGYVYAQPLYVPNLTINGVQRNVLIVATMKNVVYAFDADDPDQTAPLWTLSLGSAAQSMYPVPIPNRDFATNLTNPCACQNTVPYLGITSTPVIDAAANRLYLVAFGSDTNQTPDTWTSGDTSCPGHFSATPNCGTFALSTPRFNYFHKIFSINLTTGAVVDKKTLTPTFPCPTSAGANGCGNGVSAGGTINFTSRFQLQRAGLLLSSGNLYVAFAGSNDADPFYGWVTGVNASNLSTTVGTFVTIPAKKNIVAAGGVATNMGGIWQSGGGPAADSSGNVYFQTGNGPFDGYQAGGVDYGDSVLKLNSSLGLVDWFAPSFNHLKDVDGSFLDYPAVSDSDLASGGVLLLPGNRALAGGKPGFFHLLDTANLSHFHDPDQNVQNLQATRSSYSSATCDSYWQINRPEANIHGSPVFWDDPKSGGLVYVMAEHDHARAFRYSFGTSSFVSSTTSTANPSSPTGCRCYPAAHGFASYPCAVPESWSSDLTFDGMPGAILSLSANSYWGGTGIVWANRATNADATKATVTGTVSAYDAQDLSKRLWSSDDTPANGMLSPLGNFAKFVPPTVAGGKVYMATFDDPGAANHIAVYGLYNNIH